MIRRYAAFDIETAKVLPAGVDDILAHRPLGIACAAVAFSDGPEPRTGSAAIQAIPRRSCPRPRRGTWSSRWRAL